MLPAQNTLLGGLLGCPRGFLARGRAWRPRENSGLSPPPPSGPWTSSTKRPSGTRERPPGRGRARGRPLTAPGKVSGLGLASLRTGLNLGRSPQPLLKGYLHPSYLPGKRRDGALISRGDGFFPKVGTDRSVFVPSRRVTRTQRQATSMGTTGLGLGGGVRGVRCSLKTPNGRSTSGRALRIQVSEEETPRTTQQQGDRTPGRDTDRGRMDETAGPRGSQTGGFPARIRGSKAPGGPGTSPAPAGSDRELPITAAPR